MMYRKILTASLCALGCVFEPGSEYADEEVLALDLCGPCDGDKCDKDGCLRLIADGVAEVPINVEFPAGSARGGVVTLTTTLGVLDPLGDGKAAQKIELPTPADGPVTTVLRVGTVSGIARVRAAIGGVSVEDTLLLAPAEPTSIDMIAGSYALAAGSATSELTVYLRRDGTGSVVSAGVPVYLMACSAAGDIAVVPRRVDTAGPNTEVVAAKVTLTAKGLDLTEEVAGNGKEAMEPLRVVAYLSAAPVDDCDALPTGGVRDEVVLAVKRRSS